MAESSLFGAWRFRVNAGQRIHVFSIPTNAVGRGISWVIRPSNSNATTIGPITIQKTIFAVMVDDDAVAVRGLTALVCVEVRDEGGELDIVVAASLSRVETRGTVDAGPPERTTGVAGRVVGTSSSGDGV